MNLGYKSAEASIRRPVAPCTISSQPRFHVKPAPSRFLLRFSVNSSFFGSRLKVKRFESGVRHLGIEFVLVRPLEPLDVGLFVLRRACGEGVCRILWLWPWRSMGRRVWKKSPERSCLGGQSEPTNAGAPFPCSREPRHHVERLRQRSPWKPSCASSRLAW